MPASLRFSQEDWIVLGLTQVAGHGLGALTVDRLCEAAGRTRGSFYHHFADHQAFIRRMMEYWEKRDTEDAIADVERAPGDRANALTVLASAINHRLESRLRQLAQKEPVALEILQQVDARRIAYLADLCRQKYDCAPADAHRTARIEYACYVGAQTLWPDAPPSTLEAMGVAFSAMTDAQFRGTADKTGAGP